MEVFKIPPFDQNLSVQGRYLTDTKMTLGQLRVLPKSLIYLRADEPTVGASGAIEAEDCWTSQNPEEGFKGERADLDWLTFGAALRCFIQRNTC